GFWILDFGLQTDPKTIQNPKSKIQNCSVLDGVATLVDQSLLQPLEALADRSRPTVPAARDVFARPGAPHAAAGGHRSEPRYRMLETIREFAWDCLLAKGEEGEARRRHARYFMELAEQAEPQLFRSDQVSWLDRLEAEQDNFRAAIDWAAEAGASSSG